MTLNNQSYYLHHLGLSNWQLQRPSIEHLKLKAQYSLLPKDAKYIFVIASPFDVFSQLEQFLISVAYALKLNGSEFGYLIFDVNQNSNQFLELDTLNYFYNNNHIKIIFLGQASVINSIHNLTNSISNISTLKLNDSPILQTSQIKKDLMILLMTTNAVKL